MIERIEFNDELYALIIRNEFDNEGIKFFTPPDYSQQLAYMKHSTGHIIQPHLHNDVKREVFKTLEVLFIKKGKLKVDFYTKQKTHFTTKVLTSGDVILLIQGGHGFKVLEEVIMIEVKQGPFLGEQDKVRF
ncbi:MAG: hypothetical protein ACE5ES_05895 [Candidatus Nanoarchaeia archaeon]